MSGFNSYRHVTARRGERTYLVGESGSRKEIVMAHRIAITHLLFSANLASFSGVDLLLILLGGLLAALVGVTYLQ